MVIKFWQFLDLFQFFGEFYDFQLHDSQASPLENIHHFLIHADRAIQSPLPVQPFYKIAPDSPIIMSKLGIRKASTRLSHFYPKEMWRPLPTQLKHSHPSLPFNTSQCCWQTASESIHWQVVKIHLVRMPHHWPYENNILPSQMNDHEHYH